VIALLDLLRRQKTRGPKWAWGLAILFVQMIGPILYLVLGREEE
jgi:Phospholipase_D-nuclease N-terminal